MSNGSLTDISCVFVCTEVCHQLKPSCDISSTPTNSHCMVFICMMPKLVDVMIYC